MDDLRSRLRKHRIASALQHHLTHCKNALIRTFRRLSRRPSAPSSGLNSSPLRVLPLEMILLIASFLPKACAASFSVSCRQLQLDMGPAYLRAARRDKVARGELLVYLSKEDPDYIYCSCCEHLHLVDEKHLWIWPDANRFLGPAPCVQKDVADEIYYKIHPDFSRMAFDMIMRRHRLGHDCTALLDTLTRSRNFSLGISVQQYHTAARIINDSLFVRAQLVVRVPGSHLSNWPDKLFLDICPHSGTLGRVEDSAKSRAYFGHAHRFLSHAFRQWEACAYYIPCLISCQRCRTEYQIDIKCMGHGQGLAVFITKWMELGDGTEDKKWEAHVLRDNRTVPMPAVNEEEVEERGIKATFEGSQVFEFDSLYDKKALNYPLVPSKLIEGWPGGIAQEP